MSRLGPSRLYADGRVIVGDLQFSDELAELESNVPRLFRGLLKRLIDGNPFPLAASRRGVSKKRYTEFAIRPEILDRRRPGLHDPKARLCSQDASSGSFVPVYLRPSVLANEAHCLIPSSWRSSTAAFARFGGATFPKRDGQPYFEGIYLVSRTSARWLDQPANVLCLRDVCCQVRARHRGS